MTNEEFFKKHGGMAYPHMDGDGCGNTTLREWGMTRREHFAGEAMKGMLSGQSAWRDFDFQPRDGFSILENNAILAYLIAEAMVKIGQMEELPA